jgi:hypothetical protein
MSLSFVMSRRTRVNDALAVEGHWLGGQFRVTSGGTTCSAPAKSGRPPSSLDEDKGG